MVQLGVAITAATVTVLVAEFFRYRKGPFPLFGWMGIAALAGAEWLMFRGVEPVATYFTPLAWTAYLLIANAAVYANTGRSRLTHAPRELAVMAALSVPLWLIFEAYNLRLANWAYTGLPQNLLARYFGYAWSFATITPGILVTAELIESFGWWKAPAPQVRISRGAERGMMSVGAVMLVVPLVAPREVAAYLFAPVWLGFVLLLEPVNRVFEQPSLLADLADGRRGRLYSLLVSGWVCGWLWEFWNWWAAARWEYVFPMFQQWKIFAMPAPGYLGFLPFALECFAMYYSALGLLRLRKVTGSV